MARFRKARKSASRSSRGGFRRAARRSWKSEGGRLKTMMGAAGYGAVRQVVSEKLAGWVGNTLPFGELSDEATMLAVSYAADKYGPSMLKPVARAGLIIEAARIGEYLADKTFKKTATSTSTNGNIF